MARGTVQHVISALFLLSVVACGAAAPPTATTVARPVVDEVRTTSTATTVATSVPASSTTTPDLQPMEFLMELPLPDGAFLEDVSHEGDIVVALVWIQGSGEHLLSWSGDGWDEVDLSSFGLGEFFQVTELLYFDGNFYAFLMGDVSVGRATPSFLVSHDGNTWARQELLASLHTRRSHLHTLGSRPCRTLWSLTIA